MIYQIVHYAINKKGQLFAFYNDVRSGTATTSQIGASTEWTDVSGCSVLEYTEDTYTINSVVNYATGIQSGKLYQISGLTINQLLTDSDWATSNGGLNNTLNAPVFTQKVTLFLVTATVMPNPYNATVTISAPGFATVSGVGPQTIEVTTGTTISYSASATGYESGSGTAAITANTDINIELAKLLDLSDYEFTNDNGYITLTKYIGAGGGITTPTV